MNIFVNIIGNLVGILFLTFFILIPVLIIWFFNHLSQKNLKMRKYRSFSIVSLVIGCFLLITSGANYVSLNSKSFNSSKKAEGFTIESYNVKLNVNENNVVDVNETITVNFYENGYHGIYKFIPSWLDYTAKDGKTISRKSEIENLKAIEDPYKVDVINGKSRIKIGSQNYSLPTGLKTYNITYQYKMGNDPFDGFDEFIFHTYGDFWGTSIKNASLEVTMPKNIQENSVRFFSDKYRKNDITSYINYKIVGNTLYANVSSNLNLQKSLTVDIGLPEGYFTNIESNYGYFSIILCILIILFLIITFIKWLRHGKDYNKHSETVEFYSPEGYDSASIGYIYKNDSGIKLAISTIIELASKGFIKINENEDKSVRTIINLCPIDVDKAINRKITISKLKEAKSASDKEIMNSLFQNGETSKVITENFNNFYSSAKKLIEKNYIQINSDTINDYTKENLDDITSQLSEKAFAGKPNMTSTEKIVFDQLFINGNENILSEDKNFHVVSSKITKNLQAELDDKINDINSYKNMAITSALFFIGTIYFKFAFNVFEDLNPKLNILYLLAFISLIFILILVILMKRKNTYGEQIIAKIKGFKNYLETAEKTQIDKLVNDNPNYFYDILPYAYVLGVSKTWINKFENIPVPIDDMGDFDYTDINAFNSLATSIYSSTSSSSCGGGCSGCGGGGSW